MTDRVHTITVVLERDTRVDDVQALLDAIRLSPEERRKRLAEIGDEPPG